MPIKITDDTYNQMNEKLLQVYLTEPITLLQWIANYRDIYLPMLHSIYVLTTM